VVNAIEEDFGQGIEMKKMSESCKLGMGLVVLFCLGLVDARE
jgi:hypothetical protein